MKYLKDIKDWKDAINCVTCADSLEIMRTIPDNAIDLCLTDPPYGIKIAKKGTVGGQTGFKDTKLKQYDEVSWDNFTPTQEYFDQIRRISKNQIIFGGNYFVEYLSNSPCWIVWHKKKTDKSNFADCELAWTSFKKAVRYFQYGWVGLERINNSKEDGLKHPTQKPLELMRWCLENYAKDSQLIIDPFGGSGTTARACKDMNKDFIIIDKEEKYCRIAEKRLEQLNLF